MTCSFCQKEVVKYTTVEDLKGNILTITCSDCMKEFSTKDETGGVDYIYLQRTFFEIYDTDVENYEEVINKIKNLLEENKVKYLLEEWKDTHIKGEKEPSLLEDYYDY